MNTALKSQTNFALIDEFFSNFSSEYTRLSYRKDIEQFLQFIKNTTDLTCIEQIQRANVVDYRNFLSESGGHNNDGLAPKSIARKLASISSYFHFLAEHSIIENNPVISVKRPRREVKKPTNALSNEQVIALLSEAQKNPLAGIMHYSLLMMFFTTGMRKSEIIHLKRRDYRAINDFHVVEFKGKGGKISQKVLHPHCVEALETYLGWMASIDRKHLDEDWLFQPTTNPTDKTNLNKPLNPKTINEIIDKYAKKIGLNFNISPHSARATFIGELLDNGVDIYTVAREVNHSSVTTTQEYDKRRKKISDSPVFKLNFKK